MAASFRPDGGVREREAFNRGGRMRAFEAYMGKNPGARPNGTGSTGLMSGDARGYGRLLEQQKQYVDDAGVESGRGPATVRYGGVMPTPNRRPAVDAIDDLFLSMNAPARAAHERKMMSEEAVGASNANFQARRAGDLAAERGVLGNTRAAGENALFESESLPYGTPADRTRQDLTRKRTVGDFTRAESGRDADQKLAEFFAPANQGRLDNMQRRGQEDVAHRAGEDRTTQLGRDRIGAMSDVGVAEATAGGRNASARYEALARVLSNPDLAASLREPEPGKPEHPMRGRALAIIDQILGSGGGLEGGTGGGGEDRVRSRAEVEQFARERGLNVEGVIQQMTAEGYVIR